MHLHKTPSIMLDQTSEYHDLAKQTHKISYHISARHQSNTMEIAIIWGAYILVAFPSVRHVAIDFSKKILELKFSW